MPEFHNLKIIVVGNANVGKTCLAMRFATGAFRETYKTTTGVDLFIKTIQDEELGENLKLTIFDTGGQERYRNLLPLYYRNAKGALICFDITNRTSYESLDTWLTNIRKYCPNAAILCVGTKADLKDNIRVSFEEGKAWAESNNCSFIMTSAKDNINVQACFTQIARESYYVQMEEKKAKEEEKEAKLPSRTIPQKSIKKTSQRSPVEFLSEILKLRYILLIDLNINKPVYSLSLGQTIDPKQLASFITSLGMFTQEVREKEQQSGSTIRFTQHSDSQGNFWVFTGSIYSLVLVFDEVPTPSIKQAGWDCLEELEDLCSSMDSEKKEEINCTSLLEQHLHIEYLYPMQINLALTESLIKQNQFSLLTKQKWELLIEVLKRFQEEFSINEPITANELVERAFKETKILTLQEIVEAIILLVDYGILYPISPSPGLEK
ncbi:MAG: GTP-binding protein [Candidatus Heimdallarchaeota archaeon]|nr:GTP-binding protein [Candidatus Heimdallarchaeota archaeon]